jgi:hypothetical protein
MACQFSLCVPLSVLKDVLFTKLCEYYAAGIHPNLIYACIYFLLFHTVTSKWWKPRATGE